MLPTESGGLPVESNKKPIIDSLVRVGCSFTTRTARPVQVIARDLIYYRHGATSKSKHLHS